MLHIKQEKYAANPLAIAVDAAHSVAFHTGLGEAVNVSTTAPIGSYLSNSAVASFSTAAYARPNFAVVADGATQVALSKWVEPFFKGTSATPSSQLSPAATKYYGGQQRIESTAGNAVAVAFPTSGLKAPDAAADVLAALLGGSSSIKWTPGFTLLAKAAAGIPGSQITASNQVYSDAGLLTIEITGLTATDVRKATEAAVAALKSIATGTVSKEDLTKAIAKAKFDALVSQEPSSAAITAAGTAVLHGAKPFQPATVSKAFDAVTADKLKTVRTSLILLNTKQFEIESNIPQLAKKLVDGKASFAAVGDLHALPFAEDVGVTV